MYRLLKSVGMEVFVTYYALLSDPRQPQNDVVATMKRERGYTLGACQTRVSKARRIFEENLAAAALQRIVEAQGVSPKTRQQAKILLARHHSP